MPKIRLLGMLLFFTVYGDPLSAQQLARAIDHENPGVTLRQDRANLNANIAVQFHTLTIPEALETIARQGNAKIVVTNSVFGLTKRISFTTGGMSVIDAFRTVIAGTSVRMHIADNGRITFSVNAVQKEQGTIVGQIRDAKTKQPVVGAKISLVGTGAEVITDVEGRFRIAAPVGEQAIQVRAVGFTRQFKRVQIEVDGSVTVDVLLDPTASVLDQVVVTGTVVATKRKALTTPITVITAEDIEKRGITRIEELFRGEVPGLLVLEEGTLAYGNTAGGRVTSRVFSRGPASLLGGANPVKTYVDGVELLDPSYLGTIDPKSIERVEIITGPQAATIYGSGAMGGVMQIFTKTGRGRSRAEMTVNLKYGILENNFNNGRAPSHQDALTVTGGMSPVFSYSANLSYNYTGEWRPALFERRYGASVGVTHANGPFAASAAVSTLMSSNGTWRSDGSYGTTYGVSTLAESGEWTTADGAIAGSFQSQQISRTSNQTLSLNLDYSATSQWQHHVTVGKSQNVFTVDPLRPGYMQWGTEVGADSLYRMRSLTGARTTANYNMTWLPPLQGWIGATLTVGVNGSQGKQTSVAGCANSGTTTSLTGCGGFGALAVAPEVQYTMEDDGWGMFSHLRVSFFERLYYTMGVRVERNAAYGQNVKVDLTPTNGLTYTLEMGEMSIKVLGSYGRATRAPSASLREGLLVSGPDVDPAAYESIFANPELRPEYSRGPQGGIEIYYGNFGSLTLNHYQQTISNLIQLVPVDSIYIIYIPFNLGFWYPQSQNINVGKMRQRGWEGTATARIGLFSVKGSMSWNDSRIVEADSRGTVLGGIVQPPGQVFAGVPTHMSNLTVSYARSGTSILWSASRVGPHNGVDTEWDFRQRYARHGMYKERDVSGRWAKRHAGYTKYDVVVNHRLSQRLSATLNIVNATNNFGSETSALEPSLGRQTLLGVSMRFSGPDTY